MCCLNPRYEVFSDEQGYSRELEVDEYIPFLPSLTSYRFDEGALHFLALQDETPIGTVRLIYPPASDKFKLGRLAVRKIVRGKGVAQKLIAALEAEAKELGAKEVYSGSQVPVRPLYEKAGYQAIGNGYLDEGQPHIMMLKSLT
jgi:predicted GNAT family N-acyltransferase